MAEIDIRTAEVGHLCSFDNAGYAELVDRMSFIVEVEMKTSCKICLYKYLLQSAACVALADTDPDKLENNLHDFLMAAADISDTVRQVIHEDSVDSTPKQRAVA